MIPSFDLEWHAPGECPDGASARAQIERYLGDTAVAEGAAVVVDVGLAASAGGGWDGHVALGGRGEEGNRDFHGATCDQVADAAILIVAILLDPLKTASSVKASTRVNANAREPPATPEAGGTGGGFELGLQTSVDGGSLPGPTLGFGVVAGVQIAHALLQAAAAEWTSQRVVRGPSLGSGGELALFTGSLRGCLEVTRAPGSRFWFGPCVDAEVGVATGRGFGLDVPLASDAAWAAILGGLTARFSAAPLASWVSLEGGSPLVRPVYGIDGFGTVFQASPVLFRASFGVAWTFR